MKSLKCFSSNQFNIIISQQIASSKAIPSHSLQIIARNNIRHPILQNFVCFQVLTLWKRVILRHGSFFFFFIRQSRQPVSKNKRTDIPNRKSICYIYIYIYIYIFQLFFIQQLIIIAISAMLASKKSMTNFLNKKSSCFLIYSLDVSSLVTIMLATLMFEFP